jgi:hypothetical protein
MESYKENGLDVIPVNLLRLLSELEGSYQLLKYMGFKEDMKTLDEMKKRYYTMYFRLNKQNKAQ